MLHKFCAIVFFFTASLVSESTAIREPCKTGWKEFKNGCYFTSREQTTADTARTRCYALGAFLTTVKSREEDEFLKAISGGAYYTGLKVTGNGQQWKWEDGSALRGYTDWSSGVPDGPAGRSIMCMQANYGGHWDDYFCDSVLSGTGYICKYELEPEQATSEDTCPDTNFIYTKPGTIGSPSYPDDYEFSEGTMNTGCYYKISAASGSYVEIRMDEIFFEKDTGVVDIYRTWQAQAANHVIRFKNGNINQTIKVDSDKVLIRVWNSHGGSYKIVWKTFKSGICASGWKYFNGSCYFRTTSLANFDTSSSYCKGQDGHVVYIETVEEQRFLESWIPRSTRQYWIGLKNQWKTAWIWGNGAFLDYPNWYTSQPDYCCGETPMCAFLNEFHDHLRWGDNSCQALYYAVCEREL